MKSTKIFKRSAAAMLAVVLTLTGVDLSGVTALADPVETSVMNEEGELSLPLELYDYQSDGLLFQYELGTNWSFTNEWSGDYTYWYNFLSQEAQNDVDDTKVFTHSNNPEYPGEDASIITGLVDEKNDTGLVYKKGTMEFLSWQLLDTMKNIENDFSMINEDQYKYYADGSDVLNGAGFDFQSYESYNADQNLNESSNEYDIYVKDYLHAEGYAENLDVKMPRIYYYYYMAKIQQKYAEKLKETADKLLYKANAANEVNEGGLDPVWNMLEKAREEYDEHKNDAAYTQVKDTSRYDTAEQECLYDTDLTGSVLFGLSDKDAMKEAYLQRNKADTWDQIWVDVAEALKWRVLASQATHDLSLGADDPLGYTYDENGSKTDEPWRWEYCYSIFDFAPAFDYIYQHMASVAANSTVIDFDQATMPVIKNPEKETFYVSESMELADYIMKVYDRTPSHVHRNPNESSLILEGIDGETSVGAVRRFSLEAGTYHVSLFAKNASSSLLIKGNSGETLLDQKDCQVNVRTNGEFTITEPQDVTVLFYSQEELSRYSEICEFQIQKEDGTYVTANGIYGEFYDAGAQYRWTAVRDEDGDGIYEKTEMLDDWPGYSEPVVNFSIDGNQETGWTEGNFYGFHPLKINGEKNGKVTLKLNLDAGKAYTISYGQAAYDSNGGVAYDSGSGSLTAVMEGAALQGEISLGKGVTQAVDPLGQGRIVTEFKNGYNVDGILANKDTDGLTKYTFVPENGETYISFAAEGHGDNGWNGWISGFTVTEAETGNTVFDIPCINDNALSEGWLDVLNGRNQTVSFAEISFQYENSGEIVLEVLPSDSPDFQVTDGVLNIRGDSSGDMIHIPGIKMDLGKEYVISYDIKVDDITRDGNVIDGKLISEVNSEDLTTIPIYPQINVSDQNGHGNYTVTNVTDNGDGTYWVTLAFTISATQAKYAESKLIIRDINVGNDNHAVRNLSIQPVNKKTVVRGTYEEAQAAAEAVNAAFSASGASKGIRTLVDMIEEYHEQTGDLGPDVHGITAYDYIYYMLTYLFAENNIVSQKVDTYDDLILQHVKETVEVKSKKTGEVYNLATYGFYATTLENQENKVYNQAPVILDAENRKIYNDLSGSLDPAVDVIQNQLFPANDLGFTSPIDNKLYGDNFNYVMHSGGRFIYHRANNLVFMFTGDDDVYLYLNNKLALDLGGAHTAYSEYVFLNDVAEELGLEEGGVYNFDFYYMERHTSESELKVVTNIDVLKAEAILTKSAEGSYYVNGKLEEKGTIPNGAAVPAGEKEYNLTLTGGEAPLNRVRFEDATLGIAIGAGIWTEQEDGIYTKTQPGEITFNGIDAASEQYTEKLKNLSVEVISNMPEEIVTHHWDGTVCDCGISCAAQGEYQDHLIYDVFGDYRDGATSSDVIAVPVHGSIRISGLSHLVEQGITNEASAQAMIQNYAEWKEDTSHDRTAKEQLEINRAYHSMSIGKKYYVKANEKDVYADTPADSFKTYELENLLTGTQFNGSTYKELSDDVKNALIFQAYMYDEDNNKIILSEDRNVIVDGTEKVIPAAVVLNQQEGTITFRPDNLLGKSAQTDKIYYQFSSAGEINGRQYYSEAVPVDIHEYLVQDNVYVMDYGLNLSLSEGANGIFGNDVLAGIEEDNITLLGVKGGAITGVDAYTTSDYANRSIGNYGTVNITSASGLDSEVTYQLNGFLEGIERFAYAVQAGEPNTSEKNINTSTKVLEANVTIIPATIVYYEDNFTAAITNGSQVTEEGYDADRLQNNDTDTPYGYDDAYAADSTYSNNSYTALASGNKFIFTFKGTGFDILTRTANTALKVSVYDAAEYELKSYTYQVGGVQKTEYAVVKKGTSGSALKTMMINASYENGVIDQIPLISVDMGEAGQYIVVAQNAGKERISVDGIRIYNPLGTENIEKEATDAYGSEAGAVVRSVRDMIFGNGYSYNKEEGSVSVTEGTNVVAGLAKYCEENGTVELAAGSTVVESYTGALTGAQILEKEAEKNPSVTDSLLGYAVSGPNNELYLSGSEYLVGVVFNADEKSMLQVGMKAVEMEKDTETGKNKPVVVQYLSVNENGTSVWTKLDTVESSLEMYRQIDLSKLPMKDGKKVLLLRATEGTVSFTNIKYNNITFDDFKLETLAEALGICVKSVDPNQKAFSVISKGGSGSMATLTFSVEGDNLDSFTIQKKGDASNSFTYKEGEKPAKGYSVTRKTAGSNTIYLVKMPNEAGTYQLLSETDENYAITEFELAGAKQ